MERHSLAALLVHRQERERDSPWRWRPRWTN